MKITVIAGNWARRYGQQEKTELLLPEGACGLDLLERLCIPAEEIGLIALDGSAVTRQATLVEGDIVRVFPVAVGG